jgi:uncharacterized protein
MQLEARSRPSADPNLGSTARALALTVLLFVALPAHTPASASPVTRALLEAVSVEDPAEVTWRLLGELNYFTGEMSEALAALDGRLVKIPGFAVPLEDWAQTATEFLLVPYVGACVHTPPPPANQLVYVEMEEGKRATLDGWAPLWIEGTLRIESIMSYYGEVGFRVEAYRTYPF